MINDQSQQSSGYSVQAAKPGNNLSANFPYFTPWLFVFTLIWLVAYWFAFPDPLGLAASNWPLIIVGVFGAFIGNLTAIGGGIVFIPVMMFVYKVDPVSALKLAFVTQAIGMTSGASGWLRRGEVPLSLAQWISMRTTKKVFAFIALLDGLVITLQTVVAMFFRQT